MSGFDQDFDGDVRAELIRRGDLLETHNKSWNYDKYAHITIRSTGKSETVIQSVGGFEVGDGAPYNQGPHIGLYTSEDGVRKFKPVLKSCKITNEGGGDYTDSYLYNIEFSFTVFTLADLNKAEESVMRVGGEIEVSFGWKGLSGVNAGSVTANVFNYSFSMNEDGSFECSVKAMSAAGLWGGDDLSGTTETKDGDEDREGNFLYVLECACREAFGLDSEDGPDSVDGLGNNKLRIATQRTTNGVMGTFGAAELIVEPGWFNDDETYLFFTTLGTLIRFINKMGDSEGNQYKVSEDALLNTWPKIKQIGSADPNICFLPGDQGSYGDPNGNGNAVNFSEWGDVLESGVTSDDKTDLDKIALSFDYLTKTYKSMADSSKVVGGFKSPVKIAEYLNTIFGKVDVLTGGLITLAAIPMKAGQPLQPDNQKPPFNITIMNKKLVSNGDAAPSPYTFETLSKRSITKSVSLSSEFDSDYVLMATKSNIEKGTSNGHYLVESGGGPFPDNPNIEQAIPGKNTGLVDLDGLLDLRNEIGETGASPQKLSAYGDACRGWIQRNAKGGELKGGRYGEIQYTLNLSVTIDGVWGIKFLSPIKIDRLPKVFQDPGVVFSITAVNHEFDGQGGWDTSLETVMRI